VLVAEHDNFRLRKPVCVVFVKQAVAKENKGMKTEEEAVPTWFKSYMDRVPYLKIMSN